MDPRPRARVGGERCERRSVSGLAYRPRPSPRCTVCGLLPVGRYELSVQGESTCALASGGRALRVLRPPAPRHRTPWLGLLLCDAAAVSDLPGRCCRDPGTGTRPAAVGARPYGRDRRRARGAGPGPGCHPRTRSIGMAVLPPAASCSGSPTSGRSSGEPTTVSAIRVVAGMPPTYFGRAVAHESERLARAIRPQSRRSRGRGRPLRVVRLRVAGSGNVPRSATRCDRSCAPIPILSTAAASGLCTSRSTGTGSRTSSRHC